MRRGLRITSGAQRDLQRIGNYFSSINPALAFRFYQAVRMSCERLRDAPDLGEILSASLAQGFEFRGWCVRGFERYVIFYRVLADTVEIVRVLHSAQDTETEF